jgi:hypothetical protein
MQYPIVIHKDSDSDYGVISSDVKMAERKKIYEKENKIR